MSTLEVSVGQIRSYVFFRELRIRISFSVHSTLEFHRLMSSLLVLVSKLLMFGLFEEKPHSNFEWETTWIW